jgi:hypothetical protein
MGDLGSSKRSPCWVGRGNLLQLEEGHPVADIGVCRKSALDKKEIAGSYQRASTSILGVSYGVPATRHFLWLMRLI